MIDTHSHIDGDEFADDIDQVVERARNAGVKAIFIPGICRKDTSRVFNVCERHPDYLFPMIGLHPENITDEDYHEVLNSLYLTLKQKITESVKPIAIGEVGLDLHWDDTHKAEQMDAFEQQIKWAEETDLPLMIHSRNAHQELMEIMEQHRNSGLRGVFHCFCGTADEARELLTFDGFMLGIGGACTFKKSQLQEILKETVPLNRIVLETDSPYLTPVPHRGKRNESSFLPLVANKLSEIYCTDIDEIVQQTTENTRKVFRKCGFFNKN